jgi:hypothetical protein
MKIQSKQYFILSTTIIVLLFLAACKSTTIVSQSQWPTEAPIIDGILLEWQIPLEQPSAQVGIRYRMSNDAQYIYIAIHIPDEYTRSLMLTNGATIWLDTTAKRKEKIGIGYPIPLSSSQMAEVEKEAKGDPQLFLKAYANAFQEFDLIGFVEEPVRASNLSSKDLKVAMGFDNLRAMILELKIPIQQILRRAPRLGDTWSFGIEVNTPKRSIDDDNNTDDGLFNDRNQNAITQTNPLLGANQNNNNRPQFSAPTRNPSMPSIWTKIQLSVK